MDKQEAVITLLLFIQHEGTQGVPGGREKQIVAIVAQWDIQDTVYLRFVHQVCLSGLTELQKWATKPHSTHSVPISWNAV